MKVIIRDTDTLKSIQPLELAAYLRAGGWHEEHRISDQAAVWTLDDSSGSGYEILLPLTRDIGDFAIRMSEALQTLEVVEQRSELEVLSELATVAADVVRVRIDHPNTANGSILLDDGVDLFQRAREMMLSAACATVEPRPQFQTRKPGRAIEYINGVRVGQTERGSYVVNIISPVAPNLREGQLFPVEQPFERLVVRTLAEALEATRLAAERSATTGSVESFTEVVPKGVSANLCEAIVGMNESGGGSGLEIGLRWARSRPVQGSAPHQVRFPPDTMPFIEEAGRLFRETPPKEGFEVEGYVIRLAKEDGGNKRVVTVASFVEDNPRKINIELSEPDHALAIQAYKEGIRVVCYGNLVKRGNAFALVNPRGFNLDPD